MGYNFPINPAFGDIFDEYAWDGEKWVCGEPVFAGSIPDWVPPGALIHIEFYDGVARGWDGVTVLDATGIGQMLGMDPNCDWWSGGSQYSAAGVTVHGYDYYAYDPSGYGPAAIGVLKALITQPATIVMTTDFDEWYAEMYMAFLPEGAESAIEMWTTVGGNFLSWSDSGQSIDMPGVFNTTPGVFKQNRIAFTMRPIIDQLPGYLAVSVNGSDEQRVDLTGADFLYGPNESWYLDHIPLQAITVYPEQPVESLRVLSNLHLDPEVKSITPRDLPIGSDPFELTVHGFWFDPEAVIQVDGVDQVTTVVSISLLTATIARSATPLISKITVKSGTGRLSNDNHVLEFYDPATGPTWAAGATIFIDLIKPGRMWNGTEVLSADKATGIGLYLGFDANTNTLLNGANSFYDERVVQHEGYNSSWLTNTGRERPPAYLGALRDTILSAAGATVQVTTRTTNGWWVKRAHLQTTSTDAVAGIDILNYGDGYRIGAKGGTLEWEPVACFVEPVGESYEEYIRNRFAFTLTSTRFEFAANGVASSEGAFVLADADRPAANPLTGIIEVGYNIESIAMYPTYATTDGLLELSALSAAPPPVPTPEWVPENAIIAVDFVAPGRSWDGIAEGDGSATGIGTLIGTDASADAYAGPTGYDATGLSASGYDYNATTAKPSPAYIGELKNLALDEATIVVTIKARTGMGRHAATFSLVSADAVAGLEIMADGPDITVASKGGPLSLRIPGVYNVPTTSDYITNRFAFTVTATRIEVAVNGIGEIAGTMVDTDRPAANPFAAFVEWGNDIESITVYPPLPTTEGLLELSSTGQAPPVLPVITALTPNTVVAGSPLFTLSVTGSSFEATSVINVAGNDHTTTFVSPTSLTCPVTPPAAEGAMAVYVRNANGSGSGTLHITVTAAGGGVDPDAFRVDGYTPDCVFIGVSWDLKVLGENYGNGSRVFFDGVEQATTYYIALGGQEVLAVNAIPATATPSVIHVTAKESSSTPAVDVGDITFIDPAVSDPPWVPAGALFYADFLNPKQAKGWDGAAILNNETMTPALLGTDNTCNSYHVGYNSFYKAANVTNDGYKWNKGTNPIPAWMGDMADQLIYVGTTVVLEYNSNSVDNSIHFAMVAGGATNHIAIKSVGLDVQVTSMNGPLNLTVVGALNDASLSTNFVRNRIAFTKTPAPSLRFEIAVNGSPVVSGVLDNLDVGGLMSVCDQSLLIGRYEVYPALPDTTGLSELSSLSAASRSAKQRQDHQRLLESHQRMLGILPPKKERN